MKILDFSYNGVRNLFAKVMGLQMSFLVAWRLPESPGRPKKCKPIKMCPNNMTFHTEKDLKYKNIFRRHAHALTSEITVLFKTKPS